MKYPAFMMVVVLALLMGVASVAAQDSACEDGFRLIAHDLGETCVPETVERVVTLENSMTEAVVTLGVQPVGVADIALYNSVVNLPIPLSEEAIDVGRRAEPNLEVIASLDPDLIIAASWRVTENYDELSAIAPTITYVGSEDLETMAAFFTSIASALGKEAEAETILDDMNQHFDDAAERVAAAEIAPDFVLSQTWYEDDLATFRMFTDNAFPVEILTQLGFANAWAGEPNPDGFDTVGIESLGAIEDVKFLFLTDADSAPFYAESPLWNSLPFVQAERAYRLNDTLWLFGGPISAQRFVDAVLESLGVPEAVAPEATAEATQEAS